MMQEKRELENSSRFVTNLRDLSVILCVKEVLRDEYYYDEELTEDIPDGEK